MVIRGWKATCIGANSGTATSLLRQDYKDDLSLEEAMGLAVRVLSKTMDSTSLDSEKRKCRHFDQNISKLIQCLIVEFATLTIDEETGKPLAKIFKPEEIDALLKQHGLAKKEDGDNKE
jgi:20S proteasome subunit alpha 3